MKFLADMGISQTTVEWLKSNGHSAKHLREENLHRLEDENIIKKAINEASIILTCDLDFGTIMALFHFKLPSVIIFRLDDETPQNINLILKVILENYNEPLEKGCILIAEKNKFRVRMLPV